jgi:enoyl-[acyl-carrier protein] reductase I
MDITKVYPLDAVFDNPEDVPEDVMDEKNIVYVQYMKSV